MTKIYKIFFINEKVRKKYVQLKYGNSSDRILYKQLNNAMDNIRQNPYYGIRIKEHQIPRIYSRQDLDNIFKYDLPKGWRLIYSLSRNEIEIFAIVVEWFDHKNYEKRFNYMF